jgi:ABC-type multidrug transport system permease subunit
VISTIHQPNSDTFKMFPKFLLMMDGHTIYQGKTMESVDYFSRIGYVVPEYSNPSDYYLREFYVPFNKTEKDNEKLITVISTYETQIDPQIQAEIENLRYERVTEKQLLKNMKKAGWFKEFFLLFSRCLYNIFFHPMIIKFKTIVYIVLAGACLSLFWDPGNDREGVRGKIGASFFITALFIYGPVGETLQSFSAERPVFLKEYSNKTYGLWSYSLSKDLVEVPFQAFYVILFCSIVYFSMGLQNTFENFAIFTAAQIMNSFCAISIGLLISSAVSNQESATILQELFIAPLLLFCGVQVNIGSIYPWLRWITYFSPLRMTMEILVRNEFDDNITDYGEYVVDELDFNLSIWSCFLLLAIQGVIFKLCAVAFLRLNSKR